MENINFKDLVQKYVEFRKSAWTDAVTKRPWWKVWENIQIISMTKFLIETLDQLIPYFAQFNDMPGLEKKALVMNAIGELYDFISAQCFPLWLKAVSPMLRAIVLNQIISPSIDWIVDKYKSNNWVGSSQTLDGKIQIKDLF